MNFSVFHFTAALVLILGLASCGESLTSSSSSSGTEGVTGETGAMVSAVFSTSDSSSSQNAPVVLRKFLNLFIAKAMAHHDNTPTTCDAITGGPTSVTSSDIDPDFASGTTSKTYGPSIHSVTLTADDFCANGSGDNQYAHFLINDDVEASCSDDSSATMKADSEGVWLQIPDDDKCPEIFGNFILSDSTTEETVACHIILSCGEDDESLAGTVTEAHCTNEAGDTISLDSDVTCTIDAS